MRIILDKYPESKSDYLLPIIRNSGTNERCTYRNTGYNISHNLKRMAEMVGVTIPLAPTLAAIAGLPLPKPKVFYCQ